MLVIDSMWFSSWSGYFGFVLAEDEITGKRAIYAGVVEGKDQKVDEQALISCGNRVNTQMMAEMLSKCNKSELKNNN